MILDDFKLSEVRNTMIGSIEKENKGISGGERKRTAIAAQLIFDPSVLVLDEPTSGTDVTTSTSICKLLNKIARSGKTVISTIHQPSSQAFHYFDRMIVLSEGRLAYQGKAKNIPKYFNVIGFPFK